MTSLASIAKRLPPAIRHPLIPLVCLILATSCASASIIRPLECECFNANPKYDEPCDSHRIQCEAPEHANHNSCFSLWTIDNRTAEVVVIKKGCINTINDCHDQTECIDRSLHPKKNVNFCCCKGNMCNAQQRWAPVSMSDQADSVPTVIADNGAEQPGLAANLTTWWSLVAFVVATCLGLSLAGLLCLGRRLGRTRRQRRRSQRLRDGGGREAELCAASQLDSPAPQLIEQMAHGRFGSIWRAEYQGADVAVKVFMQCNRNSWLVEQEIYQLPQMKHPNILEFIGTDRQAAAADQHAKSTMQELLHFNVLPTAPTTELWLVTAYHPLGSLCDYLQCNTVSWPQLCRIAESMARGLEHLHEARPATEAADGKPAVVHGDFKSKNVLLKADLTVCIADFGLSLILEPGAPCLGSHGQKGTLRYMAPEVLDGAINFTNEACLRTDMYACGLVLWELVSRCTAHDGVVGEFRLPFEAEIGLNTCLQIMQAHVYTQKMRPKIEDAWLRHSGLKSICESIEECWDHDAAARVSAACLAWRFGELPKV